MGAATAVIIAVVLTLSHSPHKSSTTPAVSGLLKDRNLIIINIDSLRADHLGCYSYHRNTSPFIDSLAQQGLVFEQAMSNSSYTRESVSVLFTGKLPSSSGSTGWLAFPAAELKNPGELFRDAGYRTGLFSNSHQLKNRRFTKGFQKVWYNTEWGISRTSPQLSLRAAEFIEECKGQKFMVYLHYLDPHGPYDPPEDYYLRFAKKIYSNPVLLYKQVRLRCDSFLTEGFGPGEPRFDDMVLRYDAEIAHVDNAIKSLFDTLKRLDLLNKTFVIITADHGEEFLEHNYVEHAWTLYNESLHIPLIFWFPGVIQPGRIRERVSTVNLLPTILELMKVAHGKNDFDGEALFDYKEGSGWFVPPSKPFIAELLIQHRNLIHTVVKDNWKYIAAMKWLSPLERPEALKNPKEFEKNKALHLDTWGPVVHEELYDLSADPGEKNNVFDRNNNKYRELKEILENYKTYCREKSFKQKPEKENSSPLSKDDIKKLKSLGYL